MENVINVILITILFLFVGNPVSAQTDCSNINNRKKVHTGSNHIFGKQSFGQSITVNPSCLPGNSFSKFSFSCQGNSSTKFDLAIYDGEKAWGTPRYTKKEIKRAPTNFGGKITIDLTKGGSGDLSFKPGSTYTFVITLVSSGGGNMLIHTSSDVTAGRSYLKDRFVSAVDLFFEVGASAPTYKVGDKHPDGGIVFEVDASGTKGKMVYASDLKVKWYDLRSAASRKGSGWRAPSVKELSAVHSNLEDRGLARFEDGRYWTERSVSNGYSATINFKNGNQENEFKGKEILYRPVKSF